VQHAFAQEVATQLPQPDTTHELRTAFPHRPLALGAAVTYQEAARVEEVAHGPVGVSDFFGDVDDRHALHERPAERDDETAAPAQAVIRRMHPVRQRTLLVEIVAKQLLREGPEARYGAQRMAAAHHVAAAEEHVVQQPDGRQCGLHVVVHHEVRLVAHEAGIVIVSRVRRHCERAGWAHQRAQILDELRRHDERIRHDARRLFLHQREVHDRGVQHHERAAADPDLL
jgi:hypothetical protein